MRYDEGGLFAVSKRGGAGEKSERHEVSMKAGEIWRGGWTAGWCAAGGLGRGREAAGRGWKRNTVRGGRGPAGSCWHYSALAALAALAPAPSGLGWAGLGVGR